MIVVDILSWIAIVAGVVLLLAGGIGLLRFPEFYTRCHAAGITDTGATLLIMVGLMLEAGLSLVTVKLFLILMFLFFTSPVATHALCHAAYTSGVPPEVTDDAPPPPEAAG
jgi:multicomponent Na+:H+ antiporter subunit G